MDFTRGLDLPWGASLVINLLVGAIFYVGAAILTIKLAFWRLARLRQQLSKADLDSIDRMSGEQFESFLEVLFERLGYRAETTERYDKGADLILVKNGVKTAVQAKRWQEPVGVEAVRAVVASMRPYRCTRGMVVTNSTFTRNAKLAARDNDISLWDRTDLANVLLTVNNPNQPLPVPGFVSWLFSDTRDALVGPVPHAKVEPGFTCATCGKQVTRGVRDYCLGKPERFGGRIYCMDHQQYIMFSKHREAHGTRSTD